MERLMSYDISEHNKNTIDRTRIMLYHLCMAKYIKPRTAHLNLPQDVIDRFTIETKRCPVCLEIKPILDGFGLRKMADNRTGEKKWYGARPRCRECDSVESNQRRLEYYDRNPDVKAKKIKELEEWRVKNPERYDKAHREYLKTWIPENLDRIQEYQQRYRENTKDDPEIKKKNYARTLAYRKHPIVQICSIEGCNELGQRHHPDYDKPTEIIWLCRTHHEAEHHKKGI